MADRAVSPVVGKTLEAGLVVLLLALLTTTLYGSVVPGYRTAAGEEVGERVLASAAERVQQAVPPNATRATARYRVDLPATIRGSDYTIRVDGRELVLDHPAGRVGGRVQLALPRHVDTVAGEWSSRERAVVEVTTTGSGVEVHLS
jgi:hypothetical protein